MQLVALPLTTAEMAPLQVLTLPHYLLDLEHALEPGQLLIGQDDDGAYWGVTVAALRFTDDATHYLFSIREPIAPEAVDSLGVRRADHGWMTGDVAVHLRQAGQHLSLLHAV